MLMMLNTPIIKPLLAFSQLTRLATSSFAPSLFAAMASAPATALNPNAFS